MAREFAKDFYNSEAWNACRTAYAKQAMGLCERCRSRGLIRAGEIVHHKIHLTPNNILDPAVTLNFDNLMYVCRDCHAALHKKEKRYKVDQRGRVTAL